MRDLPTGPELAALAEEWAAPSGSLAPGERALGLRMIERCRAIAAREAKFGDAALAPMRAALAGLYGAGDPAVQFARLADDIRAGRFDAGAKRAEVRALLWALTRQKLRESNPRFLAAHEAECPIYSA